MASLIIYYSQARGNTRQIAEMIRQATNYDIAEIETAFPYKGSYEEIVEQGKAEVSEGYMPELRPLGKILSGYDTVIIGTPTWWYTMAPAVRAFLTENDFSGKTVVPFHTHGGWPGHTLDDMKTLCKGASFKNEMSVQFDFEGGSTLVTPEDKLWDWINKL